MIKRLINAVLKLFTLLFPSGKPLLLTGENASVKLVSLLRQSGQRRPLLVTEKNLLELGLLDTMLEQFQQAACDVHIFDGIIPNPTYEVIEAGLKACLEHHSDSVVVVGGGSAIDAAKTIAACYANNCAVERVVGIMRLRKPLVPFYVVPTTAGTGSEVTSVAVISETKTHQKHFVIDRKLIPAVAALDPAMFVSLPAPITATTGMDALTHAIESYISVNDFRDATQDAALAIKLLLTYLPLAYQDGSDLEAREWVALASFLAGFAFNKTGLGYVHAISHQISAHYNTPHGLANAVILPKVLHFNAEVSSSRFAALERMLGGDTAQGSSEQQLAQQFIARIEQLGKTLALPTTIKGLVAKDYDTIAANAAKEARLLHPVPRHMSLSQCKDILSSISEAAH